MGYMREKWKVEDSSAGNRCLGRVVGGMLMKMCSRLLVLIKDLSDTVA